MDSPKEKRGLVWSLLESTADSNTSVRKIVVKSLISIGKEHTAFVLSSIRKFLDDPRTTPKAHVQAILYNAAEGIVQEYSAKIDENYNFDVWIEKSDLLLTLPAVSIDLQQAASSFLVALGCTSNYVDKVMSNLVEILKSNEVPSQSVLDTLASLASANSRGTASYFIKVLDNLVTGLSSIKQDNLRLAIATMFAKFSEGVVDAVANKTNVENLSIEGHNSICAEVFNVFVHHWLKTTNLVVKNEIILALGHMSYLLSQDQLEIYAGAVIHVIISHYKRNPIPFTLTFSLALVCDAVEKMGSEGSIHGQVEALLATLFHQVSIVPNYNEPMTVKNHCEVLRCYEILVKNFPESVMNQLLQRMENASYQQRVGALLIIKHLINSQSLCEKNVEKVVTLLVPLLADPNSKVVKSLAQVIVALCHHEHLTSSTGSPFVFYLVQHCAGGSLTPRRSSLNELGDDTVGDVCCRALNLLATTVDAAIPLLWPLLLQYVVNIDYQSSLPTLLTCLAHLASLPATAPSVKKGNPLPATGSTSAPFLITRLLLLCCVPSKDSSGYSALSLLQGLSKHVSSKVDEVWSEHLPQFKVTYMELAVDAPEPTALQMWQDSLKDFLGCSIRAINSDSFVDQLVKAQMEMLEHLDKNMIFRSFLMSMVGVTLKYCRNKSTIDATLSSLHNLTNHRSSAEQESFSQAIGMCASTHISIVLNHMETWLKASDTSKRSISFMSLLKSQDGRIEEATWVRSSIVLSLGQIAVLAPPDIIGAQVEGPIMLHLLNIINNNKSDLVNDVVLQTSSLIAKSLLRLPNFQLRQRPLFLTHVINTMKQDQLPIYTLTNALQVLRDLAALSPELNVEERTIVLQAAFTSCLFQLENEATHISSMERCYSQLNVLIRTIIQHDTNPATLDDVTTLLHTWTVSTSETVRMKALDLLQSSFCTYLQHLELSHSGPTSFNQTCQLLSMLTPRFADPIKEVRAQSLTCFILVLKIAGRYNGQGPEYTDDDMSSLKALEETINDISINDLGEPLVLISKVLCNKMSFVQLRLYLSQVVIGLQDPRDEAAIGVAQILSTIFTLRGHQFHQHIKEILDSIFGRLEKVTQVETRHHAVEAICNLSKHNINAVIDTIMEYPIPYDKGVCEALQRIGCEGELCSATLLHMSHILERNQHFSVQKTAIQESVNIATLSTLTAVCSMKELLAKVSATENTEEKMNFKISSETCCIDVTNSKQIVIEKLPSLVALLLISYGSYIGTMAPLHQTSSASNIGFVPNRGATSMIPSKCALECLLVLVSVAGCTNLKEVISVELKNSNSEGFEDFLSSLSSIVALLVKEAPQLISSLVAYLDTHHNHEMQRVTVTTIFGELVAAKCCGDFELLEILTNGLLSRLNDKSVLVRRLSVRGLANFARLKYAQSFFPPWFEMNEKMNEVVGALVSATDLREGSEAASECHVTLEALKGLASIIPNLESSVTASHTSTLLIRIRLFIEKSNGEMREAAMGVLRGLSCSVGDCEEFQEQIYLHLLMGLIHLEDSCPQVVIMCKSALQSLGPHLKSAKMNKMFQDHLSPNSTLNFQRFVAEFTKPMAEDMKDQVGLFIQATSTYFRHIESNIRRAAIFISGYLISNSASPIEPANIQRVSNGLHYLLKDSDHLVRAAAASIVPLLQDYEAVL